jgi:hypothetical protein
MIAASPDPLLKLPQIPAWLPFLPDARCRFRTSDILLVRQALYR